MNMFDLVVIGGGPGGYLCAERAAQGGMKVALIEQRALGGTCLNEGCIPTKTLLNSAKLYRHATESEAFGVFSGDVVFCHDKVIDRKEKVRATLVGGVAATMKAHKVTVVNAVSESEFFEKMFRIDASDVVIGLSFPRYSTSMAKAMHFAQSKGATVISVTDSENSPIARHATHLLLAQSNMVSVADSLVAPMSLINAMIVAVVERKKNDVVDALERLEAVWDEYGIYEKVVD